MQDRYSGMSDRAIRNKTNPTRSEQDLIDAQVNAVIEDFLNKVDAEPVFGKRVVSSLAQRLVSKQDQEQEERRSSTYQRALNEYEPSGTLL
jgi:hypothetical protein